ncbi:MAG: YgiQ family radical SAM protein [Planctomycetes bacterium]|nr:YgiQ family radical SAM protein [Planctomycetota bacterium]
MFLPTTIEEANKLGYKELDIILVTGDTYIDSPFIGAAVIGKVLVNAGFRVGIIAQPDIKSDKDITRLGEPELFWGVTAGSVDSMVANYTASKKHRRNDDFTPGGENTKRPDRASIVYSNLIKRYFPAIRRDSASQLRKNTKPIVLGGIESSLRRIAHYDYWDDAIRRSILFDAKADILVYGMGEQAVVELAHALKTQPVYTERSEHRSDHEPLLGRSECVIPVQPKAGGIQNWQDIKGLCYISSEPRKDYMLLPSYEEVKDDKHKFIEMFHTFYNNNDPITAKGLCQKQDTRYLIQNPPSENLTTKELDAIYEPSPGTQGLGELDYENEVHPYYLKQGKVHPHTKIFGVGVKALETIKFSITSHRGCYGECNFCSITVHQGRTVISRSLESIIREAEKLAKMPDFKGYISDVGGPTANMYAIECAKKLKIGACVAAAESRLFRDGGKRCLYPNICKNLKIDHSRQIELLRGLRQIPGVKKVFIGSGIRHDMVMEDAKYGLKYLAEVVEHHTSGQLKIAPEHTEDNVLKHMGKPNRDYLKRFKDEFYRLNKQFGKRQFLTYYLIAAHPGCSYQDMLELRKYTRQELKITPEQAQVFTPLPSTYSALMYYTGINPFADEKIFVEKDIANKQRQKEVITK